MTATSIEWTDATWNPTRGCSKVSPGCTNCYAMRVAHRFSGPRMPYDGLTRLVKGKGPQWTGEVVMAEEMLELPLRWRKPRRVFVNSMSDLFHEKLPFELIDQVFGVMAACPHHVFQILTKRPERMEEYSRTRWALHETRRDRGYRHPVQDEVNRWVNLRPVHEEAGVWSWPLPNVWLGVSVENQEAADERVPHLLRTSAATRFLSCEPLLGPVSLSSDWMMHLDWVIVGGESGPGARPFHVEWARGLVTECRAAPVACFVKQLGAHIHQTAPASRRQVCRARRQVSCSMDWRPPFVTDAKGGDPSEWPEDLRVREFPEAVHG